MSEETRSSGAYLSRLPPSAPCVLSVRRWWVKRSPPLVGVAPSRPSAFDKTARGLAHSPTRVVQDTTSPTTTPPPTTTNTMAAKVARSSMGVGKLWMTDKGTFPIIFICGFASVAATASASRYLMANPDVCVDKERRANTTHHENESGAEWRGHRFRLANLKRNPINQSRQFDRAFEKTENQGISR